MLSVNWAKLPDPTTVAFVIWLLPADLWLNVLALE